MGFDLEQKLWIVILIGFLLVVFSKQFIWPGVILVIVGLVYVVIRKVKPKKENTVSK